MITKPIIKEILNRGVNDIIPDKAEFEKLVSKKKIRLYLGIDPTGGKLHLGHTINLLKLQEFSEMGHEAILIIGTGTVLVGDPSQREEARKRITKKEIQNNIKTWKRQAGKILDFKKVKIKNNGEWILKLKYEDIVNIASNITAPHLFQRDNFQKRIKRGDTVWYHETMYPLMQGYDSVVLDVDLEIGGTDQLFNMMVGRELQKKINNREKYVMTCKMIMGVDGKPMSKTSGNCIWIEDSPKEMFGKIMSMPDSSIFDYFELVTRISMEELERIRRSNSNPKELKVKLAKEIIRMYHSEEEAEKAEEEFNRIFKKKELPLDIPEIKIKEEELNILDLLIETKLVFSKAEARRLVEQKGVRINEKIEDDWKKIIRIEKGLVIQIGKRRFIKINA
jgi:tyrosyl-tRNA synthetase